MNEPTVQPPAAVSADEEQLRLLAIFHYIVGGLILLFSCFALIYIALGVIMAVDPEMLEGPNQKGNPPPPFIGIIFASIGSCFLLMGWTFGALTIYSGRCIQRRKSRTFSLVMACINCLWVPFGTVLGVFTLIVLLRPTVMQLYGEP